jgi:hypothetical protein
LSSFILTSGMFRNSHPLCPFYGKCVKKSGSVTHIWVKRGSEESIIFIKFIKCSISTTSVGQFVPQHPPPPPQGSGKWCCPTFSVAVSFRHTRTILKTYSESSFQGTSNDTNFCSLGHRKPTETTLIVSYGFK